MYSYIKGELVDVAGDHIVVDNNGIGYQMFISSSTHFHMPAIGEDVKVYTYLNVKEDAMQLFGFLTKEELELFKLLITVNGIGPKNALGILGTLEPADLRFAIMAEDAKAISKAPGVGAKSAQRIIIELRDKIDSVETSALTNSPVASLNTMKRDVIDSLENMGYSSSQVLKAMDELEISDDDNIEDVLKQVLVKLSFL
ncbi:MAG: Holliday junction branch migration protein RuvA [Lachnospiraceae bacterium]|jgi:Holliday junction DNA helicase RuvA|nr:Holliday junction branch migration protein RuvA [Lachnospiraceae bacterium]MCR5353969.1 Holliday junction branch migration protein RuvA [Lachnospiraceae bacterium]